MTGEDSIRDSFFQRVLRRDFKTILQRQLAIADERIYREGNKRPTGRLRTFLASEDLAIGTNPISIRVNYPIQIRFLDMKKNGNLRIYNRPIWGKIYNETLPELRYGMTEEIRRKFTGALNNAFADWHDE